MEESGITPPDRLYEPHLDPGDLVFQMAYDDLATCRTGNINGLGQIPWTAIHQYSLEMGFYDLDELKVIIWGVDAALRAWVDAERAIASAKADADAQAVHDNSAENPQ